MEVANQRIIRVVVKRLVDEDSSDEKSTDENQKKNNNKRKEPSTQSLGSFRIWRIIMSNTKENIKRQLPCI